MGKTTAIGTTGQSTGSYYKYGDKDNVVDGSYGGYTDAEDGDPVTGCEGCFGSMPKEGYWQVNLGGKYFVPYVRINEDTGEITKTNNHLKKCLTTFDP